MVKTPWFEKAIPFHEAAETGTRKVIQEHATIGLVITTDGSFGELPRENFTEAEAPDHKPSEKTGQTISDSCEFPDAIQRRNAGTCQKSAE